MEKEEYAYFPAGIWLKGNIHCHSTVSDGKLSPEHAIGAYRTQGYDFLTLTDHNVLLEHEDMEKQGLIPLVGVEHDLTYNSDKCVHIVGVREARNNILYDCRKYAVQDMSEQGLIDLMLHDGQFVVLAHPVWSQMEPEEISGLKRFHAIEIYNNGCEKLCHRGLSTVYWDMLLRRGTRVYGIASDDTHREEDLFGGWICVKAADRSSNAVLHALREGHFYSSSGPEIYNFGVRGDCVYIQCSECAEVHFISYPARGKSFFAKDNQGLTQVSWQRKGTEEYVRIECIDSNGKIAWTNPIYFSQEELGEQKQR